MDPGVAAGLDLAARGRGRRDGRGAAPRRVQPEHQGARRLLGRAVHRRRHAARAGRAHPGAPRLDAGGGARRDRRVRRRRSDPATRSSSTIRSRAARTSTTSRSSRPRSPTTERCSAGPRTARTTPTSAAWRPARCRPTRPRSSRKACASRRCAGRPRSRRSSSPRRARPTNGAATSTRSSARTGSGVARLRELPLATVRRGVRRDRRLRRAPDARRARARCPTASTASRTCSTRPAVPARRDAGAHLRDGHRRRRHDHVRLHRHRRAARRDR